jgi:outer membrane protein TolC
MPSIAAQGAYTRNFMDVKQPAVVGTSTTAANGIYPAVSQNLDSNYSNQLTGAVAASINLDAGNVGTYRQARKGRAISEQGYEAERRAIITSAKKLYMQAVLTQHILAIRKASDALSRELYESAQRKHKAGATTELDLLNSEVDWRSKTSAAVAAQRNADVIMTSLKNLARIPLDKTLNLTDKQDKVPAMPAQDSLDHILSSRPDYRALVLSRELANIEKQNAFTSFLPTFQASVSYSAVRMSDIGVATVDPYHFQNAQFSITGTFPLFVGGYRAAKVKAASLDQEKAGLALSQKQENIQADLTQIRMELESAKSQMDTAKIEEDTAQRALELSQTSYTNGVITRLDLGKAQDQYDQARVGYESAEYQYLASYFDWQLATGEVK